MDRVVRPIMQFEEGVDYISEQTNVSFLIWLW